MQRRYFNLMRSLLALAFLACSAVQADSPVPENTNAAAADIDHMNWVKSRKHAVEGVKDDLSWVQHRTDPDAAATRDELLKTLSSVSANALHYNSDAMRGLGVILDDETLRNIAPGNTPAQTPVPDHPIIVFISMSLSDDYLKALFEYGATHPEVRFVLQGWIPPKIGALQKALADLIKDLSQPPRIDIDPTLFKRYDIQSVPVFVRENTSPIRRLDGELALDGAIDWLSSRRMIPRTPVGPLSDIEEPNILDEIQRRLKDFDWKAEIAKAKERASHALQGMFIPPATKDELYWVDVSTVFKQDVTLPDGRIVVKAGTRINPLDAITLDHRYVFFDPQDPRQVDVVKQWLHQYKNLTLIATQFKPLADESSALVKELGQLIYPSNALLVHRFQIHSVPAMVEQDNGLLKITVKKPLHDDALNPGESSNLQKTVSYVLPKKTH